MRKNILLIWTLLLVTSTSALFADNGSTTTTSTGAVVTPTPPIVVTGTVMAGTSMHTGSGTVMPAWTKVKPAGKYIDEMKKEIKGLKDSKNSEIEGNRSKMEDNLKAFKDANGSAKDAFDGLSDDIKQSVKDEEKKFKAQIQSIRDKYKAMNKTYDNGSAMMVELEAARTQHFDTLSTLVGQDSKAKAFVDKRKWVFQENKGLREKNAQAREDFRGKRSDTIVKYKEAFAKRLWDKLSKISDENLWKVLDKVIKNITKVSADIRIKQEDKDTLASQLTSLKELIEQEQESRTANQETINVDVLIK